MTEVQIGVVGCAGRMGQTLLKEIAATEGAGIAGGIERPGHSAIGQDVAGQAGLEAIGVAVGDDAHALFDAADVVLDFTAPEASVANAALAAGTATPIVIGTTGIEAEGTARIAAAAAETAIVHAANMSVGVNLLLQLTRQVAAILDPDFDIEVVEMHHRHKVDAPSGTALALGRAAAEGRGVEHDAVADRGRDGITGARTRGDIGYAVLRGGNVAGEHSVVYAADNERIELTHKAGDRAIFARGGLRAALWLPGKPAGLYSMMDVLGFTRP
ncbi:MAG: 4-hydroxy-tetrahydrodipicolinate reductase [Alphaproteobacteria bacterium]|jgi:4-hydroxy-tetrahydrodipicolinate reductase|nr:4-hydroxy-tetrahydrodipicolinate reductase [Alphaproteobacteria bacterium]